MFGVSIGTESKDFQGTIRCLESFYLVTVFVMDSLRVKVQHMLIKSKRYTTPLTN